MLKMEEQYMIGRLWDEGLSISEISRITGHCRKTVRKCIHEKRLNGGYTRPRQGSILDPFKNHIRSRLSQFPLSARRIFEEIRELGYPGKYTVVREFVRPIRASTRIQAEMRFETKPGIQSQADWAEVDRITIDGVNKKLYCFTMILGYSRMRYIEFTLDTKTETFIQCHLNAFEHFGGITREILYDNTKNVVLHRALKSSDSTWNPLFEDFFRHFGFFARLCRPGKQGAKTKGKVENLVKYAKHGFYMGREYESIPELNKQAVEWLRDVNSRPHGTTKIPPVERLEEEKLDPFDRFTPYQIVRTEYRRITRDCHFSYLGNLYSVPWRYAGHQAMLRIQNDRMTVFVNGKDICRHTCREGTGKTVRVSEHFDGLLGEIMRRNRDRHERRIESLKVRAPVVEKRPLVEYDIYTEGQK